MSINSQMKEPSTVAHATPAMHQSVKISVKHTRFAVSCTSCNTFTSHSMQPAAIRNGTGCNTAMTKPDNQTPKNQTS